MYIRINCILSIVFCVTSVAKAQQKNVAVIKPGDSSKEIIYKAANIVPSPRQLKWQKLELTAFFHFGINTFTNREWGTGKEDPKIFNPTSLNADQWVKAAKSAGFKQVILTAKHHDGFCLWPSKYTTHSVKSSPWKNGKGDIVKEVSDACKKNKIGFGIYLSPWDRNSPLYGTDAYNDYFLNQLTELLTKYGRIDEVWFDGANGEGPNGKKQVYDFDCWYKIIRKLQPAAVIAIMGPDVRWVGTETGQGRETEWSVVPVDNLNPEVIGKTSQHSVAFKPSVDMMGEDIGSRAKIENAKGLAWYPAETDVSIRPGWFYHAEENDKVKTPQELLDIYFNSVGRNSLLLMNIPPDKNGLINDADINSLKQWKKLRDEIFKNNLAKNAKIISPNGTNSKAMLDGNYNSYWTTNAKDASAAIELDLKEKSCFNVLLLQENITVGQRIEKFSLEYWDGNTWQKAVDGTTVGYKRLLKFNEVSTNKVRLTILSSRENPTIAEMGLYSMPINE